MTLANIVFSISALSLDKKIRCFRRYLSYNPHHKQLPVHLSPARFRCVAAGARAGKSMLAGAEGAIALLFPGTHIWYVSSVYDLADKEFDWTLEFLSRMKFGGGSVLDVCRLNNPARGSRRIETPWGSWGETKSSQKPETLLGEELDLEIFGEASQMSRTVWDRYLYPRLGPRKGRAIFVSTPNWDSGFFRDMYEQGLSEEYPDYASWKFSVRENPTFPLEEYDLAKRTLDDKVFAEQYDGEFTSRRGLVFPQFEDAHIVEELPADLPNWPVFRCWHHERNSFNNPLVCLFVAVDPATRAMWVYDEFYRRECLPLDACQVARARTKGRRVLGNLTDFRNPTLEETLRKNLGTTKSNDERKYNQKHSLVRRLQAVQTGLKLVDGVAKIKIFRGCENLINDFNSAKWPDPRKDEAEMAEAELPTSKFMPGPLALSYLCAYLRLAGGENIYEAQRPQREEQ